MSKIVKRGYVSTDEYEFGEKSSEKLNRAGRDLYYLVNQGYPIKNASTFVGNHYLLSERQRMALVRIVSPESQIEIRKSKQICVFDENHVPNEVHIDGFNTIITLEVALSGSVLLLGLDGTVRDLAGLRGTYRLVDKTDMAINLIGSQLENMGVKKAKFYMDAPVSNSGRLGARIKELLSDKAFEVEIVSIGNVDYELSQLENVISGDAIILDKCRSWINFTRKIIDENLPDYPYVKIDV